MNQILYTNTPKKGGTLEIKTVLRIFAIACIIFGLILVGQASYAMITKKGEESQSEPLINVTQSEDILNISIKHDKLIDKITYSWNGGEETILQGKGRKEIDEKIVIPTGKNTLLLKATDINGKIASYSEMYTLEQGDTIKPEIELLVENSKVKIVAKDETALSYMSYYWNNEDETKIEVREESPKQIEEKIEILKGENTLTIVAVDKAGNEAVKEQTFKGVKKPKIEMSREGNELVVKVKDEEGVQKIEYTLNGQFYSTDPENSGASLNMKEVEFRQPLSAGENKITIKAYNVSGLQEEVSGVTTI